MSLMLPTAAADSAGPSTKNWLLLLSLLTGLLLAGSPAHRARPAAALPRLALKSPAAPRLLPTVVVAAVR